MLRDRFLQRKTAVLSKNDKSSIGGWDEKIKGVCDKINRLQDFYTTSSCSGRVILMIQQEKKGKDLFLKIWHDKISFKELKSVLYELISLKNKVVAPKSYFRGLDINHNRFLLNKGNIIKFKLEPPIIHVACRDLKKATYLLEKAKYVGFKRSSILTCDKNIILELNSSDRIEFPIIKNNKVLVNEEFLKLALEMSNYKLEKGWEKIKLLDKKLGA